MGLRSSRCQHTSENRPFRFGVRSGMFVVFAGDTSATWNPDAPILRLHWLKDGIWFEMTKYGNVESIEYLDQVGMIALAESLIYTH